MGTDAPSEQQHMSFHTNPRVKRIKINYVLPYGGIANGLIKMKMPCFI